MPHVGRIWGFLVFFVRFSVSMKCCQPTGKVREFDLVWRVVTLRWCAAHTTGVPDVFSPVRNSPREIYASTHNDKCSTLDYVNCTMQCTCFFSGSWCAVLYNMEGSVGTLLHSQTVGTDSLLLDPSVENIPSSDVSATIGNNQEAPAATLNGPCSTGDAELLPPSCVVEDDEPLPGHRRHHRSHYRRHRGSSRRHHRFCRVKWKEVNFMAAMLNIVAAVLMCTSLAEPRWWYLSGSPCMNYDHSASYLGVKQFFYKGFFVDSSGSSAEQTSKYYYGTLQNEGGYFLEISKFDYFSNFCDCWTYVSMNRATTCLENREMSGNLTAVREMSGILLKIRELSGKKSCQGKVAQNCLLSTAYLCPYRYLVGVCCVLNKYIVSDYALLLSCPHHWQ